MMDKQNLHEQLVKQSKLRLFILASIPVFLIWGVVMNVVQPEAYDPFWIRIFAASVAIASLIVSFFVKNPLGFLNGLLLVSGYVLTSHSYYLLLKNDFIGFSGALMIIGIVLQALPTRKASFTYVGFNLLFIVLAGFSSVDENHRQLLFSVTSIGIMMPGLLFKHYQFQIIDTLRVSESEKRTILETMSDGLLLQDENQKVLSTNPAAIRILGMQKEFVVGSKTPANWHICDETGRILDLSDYPSALACKTGKAQKNFLIQIENKITSEKKWLNVSSVPFSSGVDQGAATLTSFQDITDLKVAQQQLMESQMKIAIASKLTSLGEMASGIAHEVNNPLAIIQGKAFQISKLLQNNEKFPLVQGHLNKIEETVFRIQKIIQGLRTFSRQADNDPFETANLKMVVADTMDLCGQKLARSNIVVTIDLQADINFDCRPGQISQILMNLLQNASDAVQDSVQKRIDIKAYQTDSKVYLKVYDSGPGVAPIIREKIMQPFFTTKEIGRGTGLGLSISMGIARQHDGNLFLDTSETKTCFVLELPIEQNKNIDDFQVA